MLGRDSGQERGGRREAGAVMGDLEHGDGRAAGTDAAHRGLVGTGAIAGEEKTLAAGLDGEDQAVAVRVAGERAPG